MYVRLKLKNDVPMAPFGRIIGIGGTCIRTISGVSFAVYNTLFITVLFATLYCPLVC